MPGRQSVMVTYAHKRRRVLSESKRLLSSPLEVLSPEINHLTRTQMARLKRSRHVSLAEKLEDKNVEHIREHLAKRIKRTQERVSNGERTKLPSKVPPPDDIAFRTPFSSPPSVRESTVVKPLVPEQLSPVPVPKRVMSRTSSKNLKENGVHPKALASPFSSRPGSATSSPKHKGKGRFVRGVSRSSLLAKSRTLSGVFKEDTRRVSRKGSTLSLKDTNGGPARHMKHQRYPSSPSTAYMRSQFAPEDWIASPKAFSRTFYDYQETSSPGGSIHSNASFYADRPQSCSTPAMSRLRKFPDLLRRQSGTGNPLSSSIYKDSMETNGVDVEMMDGTVHPRCRTIHLSRNSIFSSSDEFTIGPLPAMNSTGTIVERNHAIARDEAPARVARQALAHREAVERPRSGHTLTEAFVAEYDILVSGLPSSPASTATTKTLDSEDLLETSVGKQPFGLPGTSPAHRQNLVIRTCRNPGRPTLTPPPKATASSPPSSPASDLVLELRSMDICGDLVTHSDGETHRSSIFIPLQTCSHSLRDTLTLAESITKKSVKRTAARNRAGTIRASDFAKPGVSSSSVASGVTVSFPSNVRRTRSGTVVGPDSKLAAKGSGFSSRAARGAPTAGLTAIQSGSDSEDELLLKGAWIEDLEYLGLAVPQPGQDGEADEMNLGGLWHGLKLCPSRRLGLRRR